MSILIKNTKAPRSCIRCSFNSSSLYCSITHSKIDRDDEYHDRLPDCPIVELPKHHGDLIDRNDLIKESLADGAYGYVSTKEIYDAHTIVEAE